MDKVAKSADQSEKLRPPLVISSEEEFQALMEQIDQEMIDECVGIPARPILAGLKITGRYDIVLEAVPPRRAIVLGLFTPEQISLRIHDWMKRRYGQRLNLDSTIGRVVLSLRGTLYSIGCPTVYGTVRFVCEPDTYGQPRKTLGVRAVPTCNTLDLIDDFTADLARSLMAAEVVRIGAVFASAMGAYTALHAVGDVQFVSEALGDLDAAVRHMMEHNPQLGLSKWASLQATEKLLKAYIVQKGGKVKRHHSLKEHAEAAAKLGFPPPPEQYIKDVQCSAGVRYGEVAVSVDEAVKAHLVSLEICEVAAQCIGAILNRYVPKNSEPLVDGMPMREFLQKHARPGDGSEKGSAPNAPRTNREPSS